MTEANWHPARVRRNFRIDFFTAICAGTFVSVLVTFMPVVVRRMGGTTSDVAIVVAAPFVGNLLAPFFTLALAHLPAVRVVAGTSTVARLVFIAGVLVATTPLMLALTTVTFWVITIANIAAYTALMQRIYPDSERAHIMGKVRVGASIAGIISAAAAGVLIDGIPAQWVFAIAAALAVPGGVAFLRIADSSTEPFTSGRSLPAVARVVWDDRRFRLLLLSFLIFGWGNLMNFAVFPIMLVDRFDAPNTFVGILSAVQSGTMIVAYIVVGRLIDRSSSLRQTMIGTLLIFLVPLGYILVPTYWLLLPVAVVGGICQANGELTFFTNVVQLAPRDRISDYAGVQSFLLGMRGTLAPFAAAALLGQLSTTAVILVGLVFMAAGTVLMAYVIREAEPRRPLVAAMPNESEVAKAS